MEPLDRHLTRGPLPLWFQISDRLRASIRDGQLAAGEQLPTEAQLEQHFDVSRTTVRKALDALTNDGLIVRTPGRGTFVRGAFVEQPVHKLSGFHEDMEARGRVPSSVTLQAVRLEEPPALVVGRLGLEGPAVLIERVLSGDGQEIAFQRSYLPTWVLGNDELFAPGDLDSKGLYALLEERAAAGPATATQSIWAEGASPEVGEKLGVSEGAPLIAVERLAYDRSDRPVELVHLWYRPDRYRFHVELQR